MIKTSLPINLTGTANSNLILSSDVNNIIRTTTTAHPIDIGTTIYPYIPTTTTTTNINTNGSNINIIYAIPEEIYKILSILLKENKNINEINEQEETILTIAKKLNQKRLEDMIIAAGGDEKLVEALEFIKKLGGANEI